MSQYLRPDGTTSAGIFTASSGTLYGCLDETTASDTDYIYSTDGLSGACTLTMSNITSVGSGTFNVRFRIGKTKAGALDGSGGSALFKIVVVSGGSDIASSGNYSTSGTWTTYTWSPDLSSISDWGDVSVRLQAIGGTGSGVGVSWLELEVPDPIYEESFSESVTMGDSYAVTVTVNATITEGTNMSDVLTAGIPYFNSITETVTLTDSLSSGILWGDVINETVVMDDSYTMRVVEPNGWEIPADPEETWNVSGGDGGGDWQEIYKPDAEWNEE